MAYKTILVYLPRPDSVSGVMSVALPVAKLFGAQLTGLHVATGIPISGTIGAQIPPDIIDQYVAYMHEDAEAAHKAFEKAVKDSGLDTEWLGPDTDAPQADPLTLIAGQARCSDLVILGQSDSEQRVGELTADIILESGRPVLIVPREDGFGKIDGTAVVGWDGSREAARAVFDALPFLALMKSVNVVTVGKGEDIKAAVKEGSLDITETLVRHGIKAEISAIAKGDSSAGEALAEFAAAQKAGLLVMGCYGHSRVRERLFGGATRHLLENMALPVLMSH